MSKNTVTLDLETYNNLKTMERETRKGKVLVERYSYSSTTNYYTNDEVAKELNSRNSELSNKIYQLRKDLEAVVAIGAEEPTPVKDDSKFRSVGFVVATLLMFVGVAFVAATIVAGPEGGTTSLAYGWSAALTFLIVLIILKHLK